MRGRGNNMTYTTFVPFVTSCPVCHQPHQTKEDMTRCITATANDPRWRTYEIPLGDSATDGTGLRG